MADVADVAVAALPLMLIAYVPDSLADANVPVEMFEALSSS